VSVRVHDLWPLGCVALAAVSLLIPATLTYDPWSWLGWGHQLAHLQLDTRGGPAWKPLAVMLATLLAPFGAQAPLMWLLIVRTAALASAVLAARLAWRVGSGGRLARGGAGVTATLGLLGCSQYLGYLTATGMSEPLLVAAALAALDAHLSGRRRWALTAGVAACLLRPEAWPFVALYAAWLCRSEARGIRWTAAGAVAIIAAWFVPDLIGSGDVMRSVQRASAPDQGSPALASDPAWEVLRRAWQTPPEVVRALIALGAGVALWPRPVARAGARRVVLAGGALWLLLVAVMTQLGLSAGDPRYGLVGVALACVLAGMGWATLVVGLGGALARVARRQRGGLVGALAASATGLAVIVGAVASSVPAGGRTLDGLREQAATYGELATVVGQVGGGRAIKACGKPVISPFSVPALAWDLGVPIGAVGFTDVSIGSRWLRLPVRGPAAVFYAPRQWPSPPVVAEPFQIVSRSPRWQVLSACRSGAAVRIAQPGRRGHD